MKKIIITWANWMLWWDFLISKNNDFDIIWYDKNYLNILDKKNIEEIIEKEKPDIIINTAWYTNVENAQKNEKILEVNYLWVKNLSQICKKYEVDLITFSTDYVFDWNKKNSYDINDKKNPINNYGKSKAKWEELWKQYNENIIIIRTSWLFWWNKNSKNFVNKILNLSKEKKQLEIIYDQYWNPTYTIDLINSTFEIIKDIEKNRWKIFHITNSSKRKNSWYNFALKIKKIKKLNIKIKKIKTKDFFSDAKRPKNSRLKNNYIVLRSWRKALKEYIKKN